MSINLLRRVAIILVGISLTTVYAKPKKLVDIQHWNTSNGVPVYFVETHQLPMVDAQVIFSAGSSYDGEKQGIAALTNSMLDEGTKTYNADEVAMKFEQVGAIYSAGTSRDYAEMGFRSLVKPAYLTQVTDLMAEMLSAPRFDPKAFNRMKEQTITALQFAEQRPDAVASRVFFETLYADQPYGHPKLGSLEVVKAFTLDDVKAFYQQYYVHENAKIVIVGDLKKKEAKKMAEKLVANLASGKKAGRKLNTSPVTSMAERVVPFPATQTTAYIGQVGIDRSSPDYFSLKVGNKVLGGSSFTSRLMKKIRVEKGYAYHAGSYVVPLKDKGPFILMLQTRNNKAKEAIQLAHETLREFVKSGPTDLELEIAKKNIMGSFPQAIASNHAIMGNVSNIAFYDLPLDYLDTFRDKISAVKATDAKDAFQRMLQMDKLVTVTVGNSG